MSSSVDFQNCTFSKRHIDDPMTRYFISPKLDCSLFFFPFCEKIYCPNGPNFFFVILRMTVMGGWGRSWDFWQSSQYVPLSKVLRTLWLQIEVILLNAKIWKVWGLKWNYLSANDFAVIISYNSSISLTRLYLSGCRKHALIVSVSILPHC